MSTYSLGALSLFAAAFLYGSQNIGVRLAGLTLGPFFVSALRGFVVVLVLVWIVKWKSIQKADWKWFLLRSFGGMFATTAIFIAVNKISIGAALFAFYAGMILSSSAFGMFFYKEKLTKVKILSLLLAALGLLFIYINQAKIEFSWYLILAVVGGTCASLWSVFSRPISNSYTLPQLVVVDNLLSGILAIIISLFIHEHWAFSGLNVPMLAIIFLGLTQVFTGQLVAKGFRTVDAQVGSIILLNDTVIGIILGFLVFHETVPFLVVLGGTCVFMSSIAPVLIKRFSKSE